MANSCRCHSFPGYDTLIKIWTCLNITVASCRGTCSDRFIRLWMTEMKFPSHLEMENIVSEMSPRWQFKNSVTMCTFAPSSLHYFAIVATVPYTISFYMAYYSEMRLNILSNWCMNYEHWARSINKSCSLRRQPLIGIIHVNPHHCVGMRFVQLNHKIWAHSLIWVSQW